ncbi:Helix-turn-helix domain-containing protein, partial [Azotobacter vinelandii]
MSVCWPLQDMTPAQKAVLISLADNANDEGVCWPSIARIAERTCLSERAVRNALRWLEEVQLLTSHQRQGRSTWYTVTPAAYAPGSICPPASNAPTPAPAAP